MKNLQVICCIGCLVIGFVFGRMDVRENEVVKYVPGETVYQTITKIVPDTVYEKGELRYKYVYRVDTVYKDVPVVDRVKTIVATVEDWNKVRDYKKVLFDDDKGRLFIDLSVQYNELQRMSCAFTPVYKETTVIKRKVIEPFVSGTVYRGNEILIGGGCFYRNLGFRVEWGREGTSFGVMYKF